MSAAYVKVAQCIQYTGSNGAAIAAELGMVVMSDDGQSLVLKGRGVDGYILPLNYWMAWTFIGRSGEAVFENPIPPGQFPLRYKLA
jgi:hypothetical protein